MTFPFLSDRNPLWNPTYLTSRLLFQNNRLATFSAPRFYILLRLKSLFVIGLRWLWINLCIVNVLVCAGACVRVYAIRTVSPDTILRCMNTFFFFFFWSLTLLLLILLSVQFKMVSMRSEKPICAPPSLSEVSPALPLKRFQCSSDWHDIIMRRIVSLYDTIIAADHASNIYRFFRLK